MASPDACLDLPVEMMHRIISFAVASYIDDLIVGRLRLHIWNILGDRIRVSTLSRWPYLNLLTSWTQDSALVDQNPIISFFVVSYQFRQITLEIISDALAIPLKKDGIWRCVNAGI